MISQGFTRIDLSLESLLESQFYCKISAVNLERNRPMKELLDKGWEEYIG